MELKEAQELLADYSVNPRPEKLLDALRAVLEEDARQVARIEVLEKALLAIAECRHPGGDPMLFADISDLRDYATDALLEHP